MIRCRGLRVGLLDGDIYGPSVPVLLEAEDRTVRRSAEAGQAGLPPSTVVPLSAKGLPNLKFLSFGHVNSNAGVPGAGAGSAAVVRGPVASRVVTQLVGSTQWGTLDFLLVDMPPGTGDIHITLTQTMAFSGAVLVTTPHKLALADAAKGLLAFDQLRVPILNIVQNMAYLDCPSSPSQTTRFYPFGRGGRPALLQDMRTLLGKQGVPSGADAGQKAADPSADVARTVSQVRANSRDGMLQRLQKCPMYSLPLEAGPGEPLGKPDHRNAAEPAVPDSDDVEMPVEPRTIPAVLRALIAPEDAQACTLRAVYARVADSMIEEVLRQRSQALLVPTLSYDKIRGIVLRYYTPVAAEELAIPVWQLLSRDPTTGMKRAAYRDSSAAALNAQFQNVHVLGFDIKGNYGVLIEWSGTGNSSTHSTSPTGEGSVFMDSTRTNVIPFEVLRAIAEEVRSTM